MGTMIRLGVTLSLFLLCAFPALGKYKAEPQEYGRVILDNVSRRAGLAPVVFDHWLHRTMFTCRVCHVDIGFSMERGTTDIKASDNMAGLYCGTCHNGKMKHGSKKVFAACALKPVPEDAERCNKCHSDGKQVKKDYDFALFTEKFPKDLFGNRINWEKAEEDGYIKPVDFLEGVSSKRLTAKAQQDFSVKSKSTWMSDIKFSHKKHLNWLGCETCHPDIFNIKKGSTQYTMLEISSGQYCGVCHDKVAFPLKDCQRCHTKPV
jgi:c(7)-type cytochrome triheme protein